MESDRGHAALALRACVPARASKRARSAAGRGRCEDMDGMGEDDLLKGAGCSF